jgi:hypothetical protein
MKHTIITTFSGLLLSLLLTCGLAAETSTPELQKLKHTVVSTTSEQVVLQLNGSYSPNVFTLKDETPRIIFDFPDMIYGRDIKAITTTDGAIVKRIRVGMHTQDAPKTRIVFDVSSLKGVTYTRKFDNQLSTLTIQFNGPAKTAAKTAATADPKALLPKDPTKTPSDISPVAAAVEAQPDTPLDSQIKETKETAQAPNAAKPLAAAKEPAPKPTVAMDKIDEKKTPEVTPSPPQPRPVDEAQANAKTETPQTTSGVKSKPPIKDSTPQSAVAIDTSGEKKAQVAATTPSLPAPIVENKTAAKPETMPTIADAKSKPPVMEPAPQSAVSTIKDKEQATPTASPAQSPPDAGTAKTLAKAETIKPAALSGTGAGAQLESVKFDGTSPKGEMVLFKLNDFHPPIIHGVEEGVPRVICDFNNTQLLDLRNNLIKADGKFVKLIRITRNKKPDRVRVVLDLEPNRSYDLQQVFFKEDNLFVIIVNAAKK